MVKNANLRFILLDIIFTDQLADIPPHYRHLMVKKDNLLIILLDIIFVDVPP